MVLSKRKRHVQSFMDQVWNQGNFSQLSTFVTANYHVGKDANDPWSDQMIDLSTFIKRVMYSRDAFPDLNFDIQELIEENEVISIRWIMSGTHQNDLPQLPATNRKFAIPGMTFYCFDEDKLCGHKQCFDQLQFLQQIGACGQ